jgi:transcriptional regulator with XRE-family HTH domain
MPGNGDRSRSPEGVFGKALRFYRERVGLSQTELAALSNYSNTVISKIENGDRPPADGFAERMDAIPQLGTGGDLARWWDWLKESVRHHAYPGWFDRWPDAEEQAEALRWYEPLLIPGLLQTEDYARAVLRGAQGDASDDHIEQQVAGRLGRQAILSKENPPHIWSVIDEGVLCRCIGGAKITHDALVHLAGMSEWPKVSVQVIPAGAGERSGLLGAFILADLSDGGRILYQETATEGIVTDAASVMHGAGLIFDTLRSEALPRAASRDLIMKVAEERWT